MLYPAPIVLIDNDRSWLQALSEYLQTKGFEVRTADEGAQGLSLLETHDIPLAVIDFNMPTMDGLELLRQIRRRRSDVTVVVLSSETDPSLPRRLAAEGAAAFLPKTLVPRLLLRALQEALTMYHRRLPDTTYRTLERLLPVPRYAGRTLPVPIGLYDWELN